MWVVDHLADLESDFSRFHRVDDIYELDGPRFFRMAWRMSVYGGVMAMRQERAAQPAVQPQNVQRPAQTDTSSQGKAFLAFAVENADLFDRRRAV